MESLHSVRTDFSPDALQKAVRFNADCSLLVTGGADGFLRLWEVGAGRGIRARHCCAAAPCGRQGSLRPWAALFSQFPSMKKTLEFKAHDGEIEDIALGPDNKVGGGWEAAGGSSLPRPRCWSAPRTPSGRW